MTNHDDLHGGVKMPQIMDSKKLNVKNGPKHLKIKFNGYKIDNKTMS
jgi:hypothetical protein